MAKPALEKSVREIAADPRLTQRSQKILRVAAYCRVSTELEEQESSFEGQVSYYTDKIESNPEWEMAGIYADHGISGVKDTTRPGFMQMIEDCKQHKIDMILTKSQYAGQHPLYPAAQKPGRGHRVRKRRSQHGRIGKRDLSDLVLRLCPG